MSRRLTERSIDHVVLERGEVANSWRTERWDSLRLLTPNWHARLPGQPYDGDDPDGFMSVRRRRRVIAGYAATIAAPVSERTTVTRVAALGDGYEVATDQGVVAVRGASSWPAARATWRTSRRRRRARPRRRLSDAADLPQPRRAARRRRARRRRVGDRRPARRGDPARRVARHAGRRRARPDAADLPGPRHLLVDGRGGHPRRALRRGRRHRPRPPRAVAATDRHAGAALDRPQLAADAGVGIVGRLGRIRDGVAQFSGRCRTSARSPTSR